MSAIVRYDTMVPYARKAVRFSRYASPGMSKAFRYGTALGKFAWKNRKKIWRASVKVSKAYKRARAKAAARRSIGERVGKSNAKKHLNKDSNPTLKDTRVQYTHDLSEISRVSSATEDINDRTRDVVNLRGFKLCVEVSNKLTAPLYFNYAVVHNKEDNDAAPTTVDWFRGFETTRSIDFSTSLSANKFHCFPINTDKYHVLLHKRMRLNSVTPTTYSEASGRSYANISKYIKINRQLRWKNSTATKPETGNIWVVYWADAYEAASFATSTANAFSITENYITYFRETK